mgnify:CR=1 FL=1
MIQHLLAQELTYRQSVFDVSVRFRDPAIMEALGPTRDFIRIDLPHGALTIRHVPGILRTCDLPGMPAFVRMAACTDLASAALILDMDVLKVSGYSHAQA